MDTTILFSISCGILALLFGAKAIEVYRGSVPWERLRDKVDVFVARLIEVLVHTGERFIEKGVHVGIRKLRYFVHVSFTGIRNSIEHRLIALLRALQRRQKVRQAGSASSFLQHVGEHKSNLRSRM